MPPPWNYTQEASRAAPVHTGIFSRKSAAGLGSWSLVVNLSLFCLLANRRRRARYWCHPSALRNKPQTRVLGRRSTLWYLLYRARKTVRGRGPNRSIRAWSGFSISAALASAAQPAIANAHPSGRRLRPEYRGTHLPIWPPREQYLSPSLSWRDTRPCA